MPYVELMGFGPNGWGFDMLAATAMTVAVAACGFLIGIGLGLVGAAAGLSRFPLLQALADGYTTVLRGVPELLVIYLFYFGTSSVITSVASAFGARGFVGAPTFLTGALAIGLVSGTYQMQVFRGAWLALSAGEIEAGRAIGMPRLLLLRRIILPQAARFALPGVGNVWQLVLKESALISVTGLVELMRQAQIGSGSTRQPFSFYLTAGALYLLVTFVSGAAFRHAERRSVRGVARVS